MAHRHTILLDNDLEEELRKIQAELINVLRKSVSFSAIVNHLIRDGLEKRRSSRDKLRT